MKTSIHSLHCCSVGCHLDSDATNFANDYFDFVNGADTEDRIGPTRATQAGLIQPHQMKWAFILTFGLTLPIIGYLTIRGGLPIVWIGVASIASGILYTGGPKPLGYMGLGRHFCFHLLWSDCSRRNRLCAESYLVLEWNPTGCGMWILIDSDSCRQQFKRSRDRCGRRKKYPCCSIWRNLRTS